MKDLREQLQACLQGRVGLIGLGNEALGDDGLGLRLAHELREAGVKDVIAAGSTPERWLTSAQLKEFDHIVFLDGVEFGGTPGAVVLLNATEMASRFPQVSTHKLSLGLLAKWVEAGGHTRAWLLGVQPESLQPGNALSSQVHTTVAALASLLAASLEGVPA